jgi:hypothetical protein
MGNHDAARVMELASETDETFASASAAADACLSKGQGAISARERFRSAFPAIPTPETAARDYSSFAVHQRELVQDLLLTGRMRLACVGKRRGRDVLLTHAGVTEAQVEQLVVSPDAKAICAALEGRLKAAVDEVRVAWESAQAAPLSLRPLHYPGERGREGGGLLYHRPSAKPDRNSIDGPVAARRFHPNLLPRGLVQVCGHTGHKKCREELAERWVARSAKERERGGLRTLTVADAHVSYDLGIQNAEEGAATLHFIDIEMNVPDLSDYPLLELDGVLTA